VGGLCGVVVGGWGGVGCWGLGGKASTRPQSREHRTKGGKGSPR